MLPMMKRASMQLLVSTNWDVHEEGEFLAHFGVQFSSVLSAECECYSTAEELCHLASSHTETRCFNCFFCRRYKQRNQLNLDDAVPTVNSEPR